MLQLYFGESAERAQRGASERLVKWCQAFEDWLLELKRQYTSSAYLSHCIDVALKELAEEWGLDDRTDEAGTDG